MEQEKKDLLIAQCVKEYTHALEYRRKRETRWRLVDEFYFGKKRPSIVTQANIHVPIVQGAVETFISKVDDPPYIMYQPQRPQDQRAASLVNASKDLDYENNEWELIDIGGKKIGAKYGRTIYKKYATNEGGFKDCFYIVDVLDYGIDPMAGGADPMRYAKYMFHDNIVKSIYELQDPMYDQEAVVMLAFYLTTDSAVDNKYMSRQQRRQNLNLSEAVLTSEKSIKLTEHYTTFEGERYKVLLSIDFGEAVLIQKLDELCLDAEWPFATWAIYPDPLEFWTPGIGELMLESNMVQNTLQSQMLDNITNRNYGMMAYDMKKVANRNDLKYRPNGRIGTNGDPKEAVQAIVPPDISPAIQYYNQYSAVMDAETGVNKNAKGAPNTKRMSATEFAGLIEQTADRFFAANRTYKACMKRVAMLYYKGLLKHLDKSRAIAVAGADGGVQWVKMTKTDITTEANFSIKVQTGALAENQNQLERERKLAFVKANRENQRVNQRMLDEAEALASGFSTQDLPRLLNPEMEGEWDVIADAYAENEELLRRDAEPNRGATIGHVQIHMNFAKRAPELTDKQRKRIMKHAEAELKYVAQNEEDSVREALQRQRSRNIRQVREGAMPMNARPPVPSIAAMGAIEQTQNPLIPQPVEGPEEVRAEAIENAPSPLG